MTNFPGVRHMSLVIAAKTDCGNSLCADDKTIDYYQCLTNWNMAAMPPSAQPQIQCYSQTNTKGASSRR